MKEAGQAALFLRSVASICLALQVTECTELKTEYEYDSSESQFKRLNAHSLFVVDCIVLYLLIQ